HGNFLRGSFCMEINKDAFISLSKLLYDSIHSLKRAVQWREKGATLNVNNGKLLSLPPYYGISTARCTWRKVSRANHSLVFINKVEYFFIVPCMIAHRKSMYS